MTCKHERLRCTNNQFFCLTCGMKIDKICGAVLFDERQTGKNPSEAAKPAAGQKTGNKRTRKKEE